MIPKVIVWLLITAVSLGLTFSIPLLVVYTIISQTAFWFSKMRNYIRWLLVALALAVLLILLFPHLFWLRWLWPLANLLLLLTFSTALVGLLGNDQK